MRRLIILIAFAAFAFTAHADPEHSAEVEDVQEILCKARIDYTELQHEGTGQSQTIEESEELAIDAACAFHCAEALAAADEDAEEEGDDDEDAEAPEDEETPEGETGAVDEAGVEACIEACFDAADVIGLVCWDSSSTLLAEGTFATESEAP